MPRGVELGEVVDDVFASVRSVCRSFVSSSHDQDFFQKAKKPACNASPSPISMEGQCRSGYILTTLTSRPIVRAILTNWPRKKLRRMKRRGEFPRTSGVRQTKNWGECIPLRPMLPIPPRVPAINPAAKAEISIVIVCRIALNISVTQQNK